MSKTKKNYKPDPDLSLTRQAEIYYGANYIGTNHKQSIKQVVELLGWPIKALEKKVT